MAFITLTTSPIYCQLAYEDVKTSTTYSIHLTSNSKKNFFFLIFRCIFVPWCCSKEEIILLIAEQPLRLIEVADRVEVHALWLLPYCDVAWLPDWSPYVIPTVGCNFDSRFQRSFFSLSWTFAMPGQQTETIHILLFIAIVIVIKKWCHHTPGRSMDAPSPQ